jgi:hypothetical protein
MTQRLTATLGLICLAVTAGLCLAAFLTYRDHALRVLHDNVVVAKGAGASGGLLFLPALMGDERAAASLQAAAAPRAFIPLEAPPATRWCLVAAAPFAATTAACLVVLGNLTPVTVAILRWIVSRARGLTRGASRTIASDREQPRGQGDRRPERPTDFSSLPQYPGN